MVQQIDIINQPVSDIQLNQLRIEWVPRDSIRPNKYNPNRMSWHDRQLLRQSLLEDGWTQPIVTLADRTIVDGEQRWTVAGMEIKPDDIQEIIDKMLERKKQGAIVSESILERLEESKKRLIAAIESGQSPTLAAITGGYVPITILDLGDDAHKMISTIRHNRARGIHQVDAMAAITQDLIQLGLDIEDLEVRLGMDDEEIRRFIKSAEGQIADLQNQLVSQPFSPAVRPVHIASMDESIQNELDRSQQASAKMKQYNEQLAARKRLIEQESQKVIQQKEMEKGTSLTQSEKEKIRQQIASTIPTPDKPVPPDVKKLVMFILPEEKDLIISVIGERVAIGLVKLCKVALAHPEVMQWMEEIE